MGIRVALHHRTAYRYDRPVTLGPHIIRLRPAPHARTPVHSYSLRVAPAQHFLNWQQDPQSNFLARVVFPEPTRLLEIEVDLLAEMTVINPFDFFLEESAERFPFCYAPWLAEEIRPFRTVKPAGPLLAAWLAGVTGHGARTVDFLVELNRRLQRDVTYVIRMEPGVQDSEVTLALGRGSCRDSAWLLVQILRHLGLAARFVSGYLIQLTADGPALDGPSGPTTDFTDLHAWAEAYVPGAGWIGLDPTSGLLTGEGHIPLACTPEPASAAPITGTADDAGVDFSFAMSVTRVHEEPRVTKPYSDAEWARIDALGRAVDARLAAGDVRLSMGGEPTFVSIDDRDGPEWNLTALGPHKRRLAGALVRLLRDRFAPGGLLHFGQGKWYPGELLPRWALGCYWRRDGEPIWEDAALVADDLTDFGVGPVEAERFVTTLAERLGVDPEHAIPGYEDAWYYLWRERRLPVNVDPFDARLEDPEERAHLARIFERGLATVVGFALPVTPVPGTDGPRWQSARWFLRSEHLYLMPGDSPMGYRLPLDSLPWVAPADLPRIHERDPFAPRPPLAPHVALRPEGPHLQIAGYAPPAPEHRPEPGASAADTVRTALCVEPRTGRLHVFMPPLGALEDYLALVAAIEDTARAVGIPVLVEGYHPPPDHRLQKLEVTPDPGVLEVNIQPATSWDELATNTTILYEEARLCRLATEKFMLDGRHSGTGGGNHLTLGGATAADSPFLRRPDLLRSLLAYWHNHPALSYAFSGLFIGPTSQHPRVDEARNDQLVELETAFRQVPERAEVPPWLVDRLFRHLLVDVTGNTHRAEFCIDKLYSPDSARGRLGLVELRSFEMPPHARMSLVQQLLVRALVARFWETPYTARLVRWGTELHDRFMLPHFVTQDLDDVIFELAQAGFPFEPEWLAPHLEFRFPLIGTIAHRGIVLELRHALEPWHVLGEENAPSGTVRYVDSSLERMQVKVTGMVDGRHVVTCNGRPVSLHPTGTNGELVAGVRYRAWQAPESLHPTIPVHTPLVFDLVDTWRGRSIGGATYHVAHPGGRAHETFPVNANEAEGRRVARFFPFGHTPGAMEVSPAVREREMPFTLDLRRC
jgi:uncharacterized protein (DUF2126 family)/transglutaminase-like putative cysteine protease